MNRLSTIGVALAAALPMLAQTTTTPSTCTTVPTAFQAFNVERTLTLSGTGSGTGTGTGTGTTTANGSLFSTQTPTLPNSVLAQLGNGSRQLRESIRLDTTQNILTIQDFLALPTDASPVPGNQIQFGNLVAGMRITVDNTYFSCQPVPAGVIVGHIQSNFPNTPFGNANGALAVVTFGYTTDNPPKINNVTFQIAGVAGLYSPGAVGTLTFPNSSVNPPGSAGNTPTIVFAQNPIPPTAQRQMILDASKSTDPNGLPLTYSWRQVNTNVQAGINNGNTATPLITFNAKGDYTFEVTATNSKGVSSTAQITVTYYGQ